MNFSFNFHVQICNMADRLPRDGLLLNRVCGKKITASRMNLLAPRSNMSVGITVGSLFVPWVHGWFISLIIVRSTRFLLFGFDQNRLQFPGASFGG